MPRSSRRELARGMTAVCLYGSVRQFGPAQSARPKTRVMLLGTAGGPRPRKTRVPSSQVVVVNETVYVIGCGVGVATHLALAGVRLSSLRHVFITSPFRPQRGIWSAAVDRLGIRTADSSRYVGTTAADAHD